jgi:hypothetical protein
VKVRKRTQKLRCNAKYVSGTDRGKNMEWNKIRECMNSRKVNQEEELNQRSQLAEREQQKR